MLERTHAMRFDVGHAVWVAAVAALAMMLAFAETAFGQERVRLPMEQPPLSQIGEDGFGRNVRQVGSNDLGRRGMNAGMGLTRSGCAYIGSRNGQQGVAVVDITRRRNPTVVQTLPHIEGSTSREVRTIEELDLLIVMNFMVEDEGGTVNNLQFWDISDCREPELKTTLDYGDHVMHEMHAWRDPANPERLLVFLSHQEHDPHLTVVDATDILSLGGEEPYTDRLVATFHLDDFLPEGHDPAELHSMSVSDDGTRVYMSARPGVGFYLLDSTALASGEACDVDHQGDDPCLTKLNPDPTAGLDPSPPDPGGHHSFVKVPGTRPGGQVFAIGSDEVGGPDACPWSWSRVIDITDEMNPIQIATFLLPENLVRNCDTSNEKVQLGTPDEGGRFRAHNPTVLKNLVLHTWYAGGLRIYDISNPYFPHEVGVFWPQPLFDTRYVSEADDNQVSLWTYPIVMDGLIYVAGINEGLHILRYTGPRREEVGEIRGPCESNNSPIESVGELRGRCFREPAAAPPAEQPN